MPITNGRAKFMYDAAADVELRNITDGAETATANEAAIDMNVLVDAEWDANEIPWADTLNYTVVVLHVSALDVADADETYQLVVQVADDEAFSANVTDVATQTVIAPGQVGVPLDPQTVAAASAGTPKWMRVRAVLGGTTPSITYGAWLV